LREFERIEPPDHWDLLAVSRTIELKRALRSEGGSSLNRWVERQGELERESDEVDLLLAELEELHGSTAAAELAAAVSKPDVHRVVMPGGEVLDGSWSEIVARIRDLTGRTGESVAQYMRRRSVEEQARCGMNLPSEDVAAFVHAGASAGLWRVDF
jgi:hypothetical protein